MNLLKTIHYQSTITRFYRFAPTRSFASSVSLSPQRHIISLVSISNRGRCFAFSSVSGASLYNNQEDGKKEESERNYASTKEGDEVVYQKTLRLVECAMFAAVTGLVYFLSNSLAIEVATVMLLFILSGPVKALTYFVSLRFPRLPSRVLSRDHCLTFGDFIFVAYSWSCGACTGIIVEVRALGLIGYVLTSSFLIRENILAVITINIHASLSYVFTAMGLNIMPSMSLIYMIFGTVLLLNSGFFVLLLHLLYSIFLTRLGMKSSLRLPAWLDKAI
ncbi:unknown protein [Arabidopsis thaliana]|uniref:Uncharacterized protein F28B23.14 n=1 Tax=Arabidopsis thaliana TaxID=3702 RepID=Q9C663_ARATH|nr:unknown protein [Arabidopsis thaliana]